MAFPFRALVLALAAAAAAHALSAASEAAARGALKQQLGLDASYGAACAPCAEGDTIGQLLRLAFHDSAGGGGPHGAGGANGCIDNSTSDNAGLAGIQARVDAVRAPFAHLISRADFFVLAATVAVEAATTTPDTPAGRAALNASGLQAVAPLRLDVRFGRVDDADCAGLDGIFLPDPSATWLGLVNVFGEGGRFRMNFSELTALMGAHSVGRMHRNASGVEGAWTRTQSSFSSAYYKNLLSHGFAENASQPNVYVDTTSGGAGASELLMLRSDIELVLMTVPTSNDEEMVNGPLIETTCIAFAPRLAPLAGSSCPFQTRSLDDVRRFAADTTLWHSVFRSAWRKLTEYAYIVDAAAGRLVPGPAPADTVRGFGGRVVVGHAPE
jgi:hypothetical protein